MYLRILPPRVHTFYTMGARGRLIPCGGRPVIVRRSGLPEMCNRGAGVGAGIIALLCKVFELLDRLGICEGQMLPLQAGRSAHCKCIHLIARHAAVIDGERRRGRVAAAGTRLARGWLLHCQPQVQLQN